MEVKSGLIYRATNSKNGKTYIGKTVKTLGKRVSEHKWFALTRGGTGAFQNAIRKHGFDSFEWEVLETCPITDLNARELFHIENSSSSFSYNMTKGGDGAAYGDDNPAKRSDVREKLRIASTGKTHTAETRKVMSEKSKAYYINGMPQWQRDKISQAQKGRFVPSGPDNKGSKKFTVYSPDGVKYESSGLREFASTHGLCHSSLSKVLRGKLKQHHGWTANPIDKTG